MLEAELLTPSEVSDILKINYRKVLDMILLGDISAVKIGRQYRIDKYDLLEYLNNNKTQRMA
mgnify:CR=1 FL=1